MQVTFQTFSQQPGQGVGQVQMPTGTFSGPPQVRVQGQAFRIDNPHFQVYIPRIIGQIRIGLIVIVDVDEDFRRNFETIGPDYIWRERRTAATNQSGGLIRWRS